MKLISADALLKEAMEDGAYGYVDAEQIANAPTIDAEPVRHGRWTYLYDGNYKCSECGSWWTCEETPIESGMLFCPNCGARMDGERREAND